MIISCPNCATRFQIPEALVGDKGRKARCTGCRHIFMVSKPRTVNAHGSGQHGISAPHGPSRPTSSPGLHASAAPAQAVAASAGAGEGEDMPAHDHEAHAHGEDAHDGHDFHAHELESDDRDAHDGDDANDVDGDEAAVDIETEAARLLAASRRKSAFQRRRHTELSDSLRKWAGLAAMLVVFTAAAIHFRVDVVRGFPASAAVYERAGWPVNIRGFDFRDVVLAHDYENGLPVLTVRGEVVNVVNQPVVPPHVRIGLRDAAAQEIYHWTVALADTPLGVRQSTRFVTRLASPPSEARDILVRFSDADEAAGRK